METKPIGILYEHPEWFIPLFAELDRRGLAYERIPADGYHFDPSAPTVPYGLVVNRVSPSSYLRDHMSAIFQTQSYLAYLEAIGVPVINGTHPFALETSKSRQLTLLAGLGIPHPRSRIVNHTSKIKDAARQLAYPLIIKPNIGGSGALMRRFETPDELESALVNGELDPIFGIDQSAVVQEYHPPKGGSIVRVEALDDAFLYAIRIYNDPNEGFNLCPADICQVPEIAAPSGQFVADDFAFCPVETPAKTPKRIEVAEPPHWVVEDVLRLFRAAHVDIGGVEYLESERDGALYLYDINPISNFVTDAPRLVGFDPFVRFVDFIERRAGLPNRQFASSTT
ncbi:MAG: ATP-grasp domain-containing protein [Thermomicrobiales bacterium]